MSRPSIFGVFCSCLFASTAAVGWGQEYLDLYKDQPSSKPPSLADRLLSLKDKLRRDQPSAKQPTTGASQARANSARRQSRSRSNPRNPRYRNTAQSSLQPRRVQSNNVNRNDASQLARQPANTKPLPNNSQDGNSQDGNLKTGRIVKRPKSGDFLPGTKFFSRGDTPLPPATQFEAKRLTRAKNLPRAGTAKSQPAPPRIARKSPTTSRANELDAALADLLKPQARKQIQRSAVKSTKSAARKSPQLSAPTVSNTFDLRKALLDDEADTIAKEVATATEAAVESDTVAAAVKAVEPKVDEALVEKPQPVEKSPEVVAKPAVKKTQTPLVEAAPKAESSPPIATKPVVTEPVASQPIVIEPAVSPPLVTERAVIAAAPQQAITIAKPRPSPTFKATNSSRVVADPFDRSEESSDPFRDAAKERFGTSQQATNPMRSFHPVTESAQAVQSIARPERGLLQTTQQPVIVSHVEGPRSILVGREATYKVTLENTSNTLASELSTEISVPEWAELVDAMSTSGVVERSDQGASASVLEWKLSELAPRSSQALRLRLIPRTGRPLQLGVRWSQAPAESQAIVEVQEPKLEIAISGPQEVRYGKPQRYRLTLRNPGSGLTEQVSLRLVPPGGDPQAATTQKIGDLKPGEVRDIDLELTAREAGELLIQADAIADGGLKAHATKSVLCRKPELSVDWRGPDKKYAGTVAAYYFRIQNPGTATTEPVDMSVKLPVGAEFVSASEGYSINTTTGVVSWQLAGIDVKEEQFMQLRCKIDRAGKNDFEVRAKTGDGELSDSKVFHTEVVALADLKLEVTDPQGPLPLGELVVYEIRVRNRGTTHAEDINVVGLFSEGIDPTTVEGAQFTLRDGRVSFHPIKSLPAGREILLRIHAKASQVGTHIFRTEVVCPKLDIKLAVEETTRFFQDEHRWEDGQTPYSAEREATLSR